jgi:hypothetical protein
MRALNNLLGAGLVFKTRSAVSACLITVPTPPRSHSPRLLSFYLNQYSLAGARDGFKN